jgi:DNA-binding NarL/FixJ family response regulator
MTTPTASTAANRDPLRRAADAEARMWDKTTSHPSAVLRERDVAVGEAVASGWSIDEVAAVLHVKTRDVAFILAHPHS